MSIAHDWLFASIREQANALRSGAITSHELVSAHLTQIERLNPRLNAVVHHAGDGALVRAREADEARAKGASWGILHGIPFSLKDSFLTIDMPTTSGTQGRIGFMPDADAFVVRALKQAGGIPIAKTNCSELVLPFETDNLVIGRTNNPHDLTRTAGGSSGGEASLIAIGGSPLGVAADAGGSVRVPAHFCGICGLKPTTGRISRGGHFPLLGGAVAPLSATGIMARHIDDIALALPLLLGIDPDDPHIVPMPLANPHAIELMGLRIAYHADNGIMPADVMTIATVKRAIASLMGYGVRPVEAVPDGLAIIPDLLNALFGADGGDRLRDFLARLGTVNISPPLQMLLDRWQGTALNTTDFMRWLGRWDAFRAQFMAWFTNFDVLITPVASMPAPPHGTLLGDEGTKILSYSILHNIMGLPAATVPVSWTPEGLPIGVQIIAHPWREDIVLAVARALEQTLGGYQIPPLARL